MENRTQRSLQDLKRCLLTLNSKTALLNIAVDGYLFSTEVNEIAASEDVLHGICQNADDISSKISTIISCFQDLVQALTRKETIGKGDDNDAFPSYVKSNFSNSTVTDAKQYIEMEMQHSDEETDIEDNDTQPIPYHLQNITREKFDTNVGGKSAAKVSDCKQRGDIESGEETGGESDENFMSNKETSNFGVVSDTDNEDSFWVDNTEADELDQVMMNLEEITKAEFTTSIKQNENIQEGDRRLAKDMDEDLLILESNSKDEDFLSHTLDKEKEEGGLIFMESKLEDEDLLDKSLDQFNDAADSRAAIGNTKENISKEKIAHNHATESPPDNHYIEILKHHFGFGNFRPFQWNIIRAVLKDKKDQCVIMATGFGKSLCYQFPSIYTGGLTLVVSPLISLMEDQVRALSLNNIPAAYLGSAQSQSSGVYNNVKRGAYRLLYVSPEYLVKASGLLRELKNGQAKLTLIAVDEAHCVSQWGHDFRSAYRDLDCIRKEIPDVPIMALTATATPPVRRDICQALKLQQPEIVCTGFDRPNLYFEVRHKSSNIEEDIKPILQQEISDGGTVFSFPGSSIVYCPTKKQTESVCSSLRGLGISCDVYHAGLSLSKRKMVHGQFIRDELQCIVATVAFGMGIDKPDIRIVVHYGAPKDIESYYQEVGRAGRDGYFPSKEGIKILKLEIPKTCWTLKSYCYAFYRDADFGLNRQFVAEITDKVFREHKLQMFRIMEEYLMTRKCRRRMLLLHFDPELDDNTGGTEECCDNCKRKLCFPNGDSSGDAKEDQKQNFGKEAVILLEAIKLTGGRFGFGIPISVVRGSHSNKLHPRFLQAEQHGSGKHLPPEYWKALGRQLLNEGYLAEETVSGRYGSTVDLSASGRDWLMANRKRENPELYLCPHRDLEVHMKRQFTPSWKEISSPAPALITRKVLNLEPKPNAWRLPAYPIQLLMISDNQAGTTGLEVSEEEKLEGMLYQALIVLRRNLADGLEAAPHFVATNRQLSDIAKQRPTNQKNLLLIDGISAIIASRFGKDFTDCVSQFCAEHKIQSDLSQPDRENGTENFLLQRRIESNQVLSETVGISYNCHILGAHIDNIAKQRILVPDTILSHLATALLAGYVVNYNLLGMKDDHVKTIARVVRAPAIRSDITSIKAIKDKLPPAITYGHLRFVLAMMEVTFGLVEEGEFTFNFHNKDLKPNSLSHRQNETAVILAPVLFTNPPQMSTSQSPLTLPSTTNGAASSESSSSEGAKRKLPAWITSSSQKPKMYKRSNSGKKNLF